MPGEGPGARGWGCRVGDQVHGRRGFMAALGLGAAGVATGGLGWLAGCSDDGGATKGAGGTSTTPPTRAIPAYDPERPYWEQGNFAPVTTEETFTDLEVTGSLPPELSGLFVRNGSNPPSGSSAHWFLGDGMVHGVSLSGGEAQWYRNRYVRTPINESGKDLLSFGGVPGKQNNQSNVALVHHAGKLLTTGEVGWPFELSPEDLSTVGRLGLRREAGRDDDRPPQGRPRHRAPALLRLRVRAAGADLLRGRPRRAPRRGEPHRRRPLHDDPRLRHHRARRRVLGGAGDVRGVDPTTRTPTSPSTGTRTAPAASASCRSTARATRSAGSTSTRRTCSTASTPTATATTWCCGSTSCPRCSAPGATCCPRTSPSTASAPGAIG